VNRRERLMRTLHGKGVDHPPVCFYEINGYDEHPEDPDPFNIYNHPSWEPLIKLAREKSDRIVMRGMSFRDPRPDPGNISTQVHEQNGHRETIKTLKIGHRVLTEHTRRDRDVNTIWVVEHLLKDKDDLLAYLSLPDLEISKHADCSSVLQAEKELDEGGIVMIDTPDPLCLAAGLFSMSDYTVLALSEPALFHQLLDRFARKLLAEVEVTSKALPGRLWRIYGPEYASPPYLPPRLFREYVVSYITPIVSVIQREGGFARIHCHGRIRAILADIASTGCSGLDPIEPPPQGDIELFEVRQRFGQQMVLFGNLEASDLETLPTWQFEHKIHKSINEGSAGHGRGFVLMPSSCPYGRVLPDLAYANYVKMIELAEEFG
jgi:uroporphyrinogen-III decarboxylase